MQLVLLPVQRGSTTFASRLTFCTDTLLSTARCWAVAGTVMLPIPGATLQFAAVSSTVQLPPTSAVPQPPETVRLKLSEATVPGVPNVVVNSASAPSEVPAEFLATTRKW